MPEISIITATYNAADTLVTCLDSVREQSIDAEHILIDGGSTDATLDIADSYKSEIAKLVSEPDHGIYDAMNKGIGMATGEIIGILNADDYYPSNDVLPRVQEVFADKNIQACYGDLLYVDGENSHKV
ncbi:MAG: glycosyltransferase, partial [Gammaproteobacteria bacterium]|nr:glycosyltransferase [Gammaproteobacteria bacterium]